MSNEPIKVLIGDDTAEYGVALAGMLKKKGIFAYTRKKDGMAVCRAILNDSPDIVITDLSLPELDAIAIMNKLKKENIRMPAFIISSSVKNSFIERQVIESGATYLIIKPYELVDLCSIVDAIVSDIHPGEQTSLEMLVTETIQKIGIPAHVKGYRYLRTAIIDAVDDISLMNSVTKQLYPVVAAKHDTTSTRVERAIRHAIGIAWARGNSSEINKLFGYSVNLEKSKPTNSEFIALLTDRLRLTRNKSSSSLVIHN